MEHLRAQILKTLNHTYVQAYGHVSAFGHGPVGTVVCIEKVCVSPWKPLQERSINREWFDLDHTWIRYVPNPVLNKGDKVFFNAWVTEYQRSDGSESYGLNSVKYMTVIEAVKNSQNITSPKMDDAKSMTIQ